MLLNVDQSNGRTREPCALERQMSITWFSSKSVTAGYIHTQREPHTHTHMHADTHTHIHSVWRRLPSTAEIRLIYTPVQYEPHNLNKFDILFVKFLKIIQRNSTLLTVLPCDTHTHTHTHKHTHTNTRMVKTLSITAVILFPTQQQLNWKVMLTSFYLLTLALA